MTVAVGKPLARTDGRAKITGAARYASDFQPSRMAHAVLVQSTIARGTLLSIDVQTARQVPGVLAILTHENAPKLDIKVPQSKDQGATFHPGENLVPLEGTEIFFAGQNLAVVVAETLEQAQYAASLLRIRYQETAPVLTIEAAEKAAAGDPTNGPKRPKKAMGQDAQHDRGDVETALAEPGLVKVEATYVIPVETNNPMEPSATVAEWDGDRLTVQDSTQSVVSTRNILAHAFGVPKQSIRVLCPFTGGGFGCKGFQWPHTLLAAMAARVTRRPVQLALTRAQMFTSVGHRPPTVHRMVLAARRDGALQAMVHDTTCASSPVTEFIAACGPATTKVLYACENVSTPTTLLRVNVGAPTPMRAPSECPGSFAIESAMDELAIALGMDPVELRLRNHADRHPASGKPWSTRHLKECYARGAEMFGWQRRTPEPGSMRDGGRLLGWGMATALYPAHSRPSEARVRMTADGHAVVQAATQELGTGAYTIFTQISADALGLPVERVTFELGDSDLPEAPGSGGSCTTASVSEAIVKACAAFKEKLAALATADPASPLHGVAPGQLTLADGRLTAVGGAGAGGGRGVACTDILAKARLPVLEAEASVKPPEDKDQPYATFSFGSMFCEVAIDPRLPRVEVRRVVSVVDVGRVINPRTTRSQMLGAITMGLGMALTEHTVYDPRSGRPLNANFADYSIPVNADIQSIDVDFIDEPDLHMNSLGCRGVGEIGITGIAAAVANAVHHATGRRLRELPLTLDKLL
jgi:xanthine dehydrogenase YagR molybdenum-binding subunit